MLVLVVSGDVGRRELFYGIRRLDELQDPAVRGCFIRSNCVRAVVVILAQKVDDLHHSHDLVLGEFAV